MTGEELRVDVEGVQRVVDRVLPALRPSPAEVVQLERAADDLLLRAAAVSRELEDEGTPHFEPILVGSAAKDTWLPGRVDLDVFLLFSPDVDRATLEEVGLRAGKKVLPNWTLKYAEHPYTHGRFEGFWADVVPAYKVTSAEGIQSAVDRTPFHNEYVMEALRVTPERRDDIRLFKAWLKGVDAYGAETALGGVSGYLTEVLVLTLDGFSAAVRWCAQLERGVRLDPSGRSTATFTHDEYVVVDPVDPTRNAASALRPERAEHLKRAARAFLAEPDGRFFAPPTLPIPTPERVRALLDGRGVALVRMPVPDMREDAVVPHMGRAAEALARHLDHEGFDVVQTDGGRLPHPEPEVRDHVYLLVMTKQDLLPETRLHLGPPVDVQSRVDDFVSKYEGRDDVIEGPLEVTERGRTRMAVRLRERERSLADRIRGVLKRRVSLGKHVDRAVKEGPVTVLSAPEAVSDPKTAHVVAKALCPLPPWERTGEVEHDFPVSSLGSERVP